MTISFRRAAPRVLCATMLSLTGQVASAQDVTKSRVDTVVVVKGTRFTKHYPGRAANSLWRDLEASYDRANIKPTSKDKDSLRVLFVAGPVGKRIGTMPVERAITCGDSKKTPASVISAASIRITSELVDGPDGADLYTTMEFDAMPTGADGVKLTCQSTGDIETRLTLPGGVNVFRVNRGTVPGGRGGL